jgi:hypothetical protein
MQEASTKEDISTYFHMVIFYFEHLHFFECIRSFQKKRMYMVDTLFILVKRGHKEIIEEVRNE